LSHAHLPPRTRGRIGLAVVCALVAALCLALVPGAADAKGKGKKVGHQLNVMTRNLYLGGNLRPLVNATNINQAVDLGGEVRKQVYATRFPSVRAALVAKEILKKRPDVVGLQEVALWRFGPLDPIAALNQTLTETQVDPQAGDFRADLLKQLSKQAKKGKKGAAAPPKYRLVVLKPEFDAELPVNNGSGGLATADRNERLTYSDAILVRKGVKVSNPTSGTFNVLLRVNLAGAVNIDVRRGWAAVDVKAGGRKVHFVTTHLEAYDDQASNNASDGQTYPKGGIREAQAKQLVGPGGPASRSNTILIGDLNSDFPVHGDQVLPGDALAFQTVLGAGFKEKALTPPPFSCCIADDLLANPSTAGVTHQVDHIMSNSKKVKFQKGKLTSTYANGLWSSDHFGVFSQLLIK
jgi:Endonuclease/Exonuclease/phosphatase family